MVCEDTPSIPTSNEIYFRRTACLQHWLTRLRHIQQHPLLANQVYPWNLTWDAATARAALGQRYPLRRGGLVFAQSYNVLKNLITTISKDHMPFGNPRLEGLRMGQEVLQSWHEMIQTGLGKKENFLELLWLAYQKTKRRVHQTLEAARQTTVT